MTIKAGGAITKRSGHRSWRQWVSIVLLLTFTASAALRAGVLSAAWATSDIAPSAEMPEDSAQCTPDPTFERLMAEISEREDRATAFELELEQRKLDIEMSRKAVIAQLEELKAAEVRLQERMASSSTASEGDLTQLTAVYQAMKPKVAAELFSAMEPEFAAGFLARMSPEAAAAVMSGLAPDVAYALSVVIAGRNANAIKE